ncbi:hypothetical protein ACFE04_024494 [Oxalis oulophora]
MSTSVSVVSRVAVIGSGISGAVCASTLARNGVLVTLFDSARGPGGRMSTRRERTEDGKELMFDHGAPFFNVHDPDALSLVQHWESKGLVAQWKDSFGCFDRSSRKFVDPEHEQQNGLSNKYVGMPGMNSICKALCHEPGVESKFGVTVGKVEWSEGESLWSLTTMDGQNLGQFSGVVASDKNIASPRFTNVTGQAPPLVKDLSPELAVKLQDIPVAPCFALMLAFAEPLSSIPVKGFSFKNSEILNWAHCDSSKPGRSDSSERWVLHSTMEYAKDIIARSGLQKPSNETLTKVAEDMLKEFEGAGFFVTQPFFRKAHRWGGAFPATSIAKADRCLWDQKKRLAICGDFCVSPNVEGAILSGLAAASKLTEILSSL